MENCNYIVRSVGDWDGQVYNNDGEPVSAVMRYEDACDLRWSWLTEEERQEIIDEVDLANEMAAEAQANRLMSAMCGA